MITDKKLLYIGTPLSLVSGIILIIDSIHQELRLEIVLLLIVTATLGLFLCHKSGAFKK